MMLDTGKDLKHWRKKNHLTQQQLSNEIHFSKDRISHVESNNEPLSPKLKQYVKKLDTKLNPPAPEPPLLVKTWKEVLSNNEKRNHFFDKELVPIENKLSNILANIPDEYDKTISYLGIINTWLDTFSEMINQPYINDEDYNEKTKKALLKFRKSLREYKKIYKNRE